MKITITEKSTIEKTEKGITVDDQLVLLKDYIIYYFMYINKSTKEKATKYYNSLTAEQILAVYILTYKGFLKK